MGRTCAERIGFRCVWGFGEVGRIRERLPGFLPIDLCGGNRRVLVAKVNQSKIAMSQFIVCVS